MLVIRRRLLESIIIEENGFDIKITPVRIKEGGVRLAVKAPERKVLRKEIVEKYGDTGEHKDYSAGTLVLERREKQSIIIDDIIEILLTKIEGSKAVRIGIVAPKNFTIQRS